MILLKMIQDPLGDDTRCLEHDTGSSWRCHGRLLEMTQDLLGDDTGSYKWELTQVNLGEDSESSWR